MSDQDDFDPKTVTDNISEEAGTSKEDSRMSRGVVYSCLVISAMLVVASMLIGQHWYDESRHKTRQNNVLATQSSQARSTASAAQAQADGLASQVQAACRAPGTARTELIKLGVCQQANSVKSAPAAKTNRVSVRQVSSVAVVGDALVVTYTDGSTANLGRVVGKSGEIGATGAPGKPGKNATGAPGKDGKNGDDGRGIVSASPDTNGHLIVTYTDGTTKDAGIIVGKDGTNGKDGQNGRSVTGTTVSDNYHLIVTYSDGTTSDAGQLPPGPKGDPGQDGTNGKDGSNGKDAPKIISSTCQPDGTLVFKLDDGSTIPVTDSNCRPVASTTTVTETPSPTSTEP